jgi:hypothetical protein
VLCNGQTPDWANPFRAGIGALLVGKVIALAQDKGLGLSFSCTFLVKYAREHEAECRLIQLVDATSSDQLTPLI